MFCITHKDVASILYDYGVFGEIRNISELQRSYYERDNPDSTEVRLIVKVVLENDSAFVIRFKNENDVHLELIESQCQFANFLKNNGIPTPTQYQANEKYANWYSIGGYDVIVTLEQFVENEIKVVDEQGDEVIYQKFNDSRKDKSRNNSSVPSSKLCHKCLRISVNVYILS